MPSQSDPRVAKCLTFFAAFCSAFSVGFGLFILIGWTFHVRSIETVFFSGQVAVKANTGLCFALIGIAFWLVRKENQATGAKSTARMLALLVCFVGLLSFLEFWFGWSLGIDNLLFRAEAEDAVGSVRPGLMSPITAVGFVLLGLDVFLLDSKSPVVRRFAQLLVVLVVIVCAFGILEFLLNFNTAYTHIALPTALLLFALSFAMVFARTEWGLGRLLASSTMGGTLSRRLLPASIIVPILIGWLRSKSEAAGLLSDWVGVAIMIVSASTLLAGITTWTGFVIDRTDMDRRAAEESARRLVAIVTCSNDAIFGETLNGIVTSWNAGAEAIYGYSAEEIVGKSIAVAIPPEGLDEFRLVMQRVARGEQVRHHETLRMRKDGEIFHVSLSISPVRDEAGTVMSVSTVARDISERKRSEAKMQRMNRTLRALSECTEELMRATDEFAMLQRVCDVVVKVAGYHMAWVGYADRENNAVVPVAASGFEEGYLETANISLADVERGRGPTGSSIRTGKATVCNDVISDPRMEPWRAHALRNGYRSSMAVPLKTGTEVIGALTIYAEQAGRFEADEQRLLEELASNMTYAITTLRAHSERNRAEEALRESEVAFGTLANLVPQLVWMCTPDGLNTYFNQRWVDYTGLTLEESYGRGWNTPFHPDDKQVAWDAWNHAVATGDTYRVESRLRAADGSYRWFLMRGVPLRDAERRVVKWFGTCTDIDDMKRNQEQIRQLNQELEERVRQRTAQLAESEQRVRRKLDSILSPEGDLGRLELADVLDIPIVQSLVERFYAVTGLPTALIDLHGKFVVAVGLQEVCTKFHRQQPEACQNCLESDMHLSAGVASGDFKIYKCKNNLWDVATPIVVGGKHLGNLFTGQFFFADEPFNEEVFRAQARKYGFEEIEYFAALAKTPRLTREFVNESMTFLAGLAQVLSQTGHSAVKLARSVEEIRRVNTELSASVKELEAFTYSVSHDLRAPLRHISGFSKILIEEFGASLPPDAQHHLQRIEEGTRRMGMLVDDLLNLARVGRSALSLQVTGLKSVVEEVIGGLAPDVGERNVEWKVGRLPYVECDPGLMKQVFQNLLSNALKFTRPCAQALIEIGLAEENGSTVIYVRDNGVGFSMKYADKLFGVFQRLHRPEDFEGTGVGLATVQRIIQKHGGRIWATADLGKGATFYFSLASADKAEPESSALGAGVKT